MKKIISVLISAILMAGSLVGCGTVPASSAADSIAQHSSSAVSQAPASSSAPTAVDTAPAARTAFRIASLKGPTTMGLVKLMQDKEDGLARHDYNVTMYGAADEIAPQLIKGDIDVALVPCNLASVLYNKTKGKLQMAAINTLGVLYVVETGDTIKTVADLKGKTIYTTGKGTTPEYVLSYVLEQNGLKAGTDVTIEYKSEATEVAAAMESSGNVAVAMLPQPYVTTLAMKNDKLRIALDMTKEWDKVSTGSSLVTGVVVARREFIEQNEAAFNEFLADYKASTQYVNANVDKAADLVVKYEIVPKAPIAIKAIPACNITFISGADMKAKASGYLTVLSAANMDAVGGALPNDDFYYIPKQ